MPKTGVFILDDHPAMRHGIVQLINATTDFEIAGEAGSKAEALELIKHCKPELCIVDISLAEGETAGLEFVQDLHRLAGAIPVLVLSMHDEQLFARRALARGARGYLMKQEPVREILKALRIIHSGGIYLSPALTQTIPHQITDRNTPEKNIHTLSHREFEVFCLLGRGFSVSGIGERLCLGKKTIESHKLNMRKKLGIKTMKELIPFAIQWVHQMRKE